jgi:hypothetical protein
VSAQVVAAISNDENTGMVQVFRDGDWSHIRLGRTKWAMVRVAGETIVTKREIALGNIEFEIQRLTNNGEFEAA